MLADCGTPFGPVVFIFPFNDFLDCKDFSVFIPAWNPGTFKMDYSKTASPDIYNRVAFFQSFFLGYFGGYTVKMYRNSCVFVGDGRGKVPNGFAAPGTIVNGQGLCGQFRRGPFGPLYDPPPVFFKPETITIPALVSPEIPALSGLIVLGRRPSSRSAAIRVVLAAVFSAPKRAPAIISSPSAAARNNLLPGVYQEARY
jgi:hypothetical protein